VKHPLITDNPDIGGGAPAGFTSLRFNPQYAVAPDDRRFLMVGPLKASTPDELIFVQNWVEELKTRAMK
jgi:hypothetical protein